MKIARALLTLACAASLSLAAQAQDPGRALGGFLRQVIPGGLPTLPQPARAPAAGGDLVQLLSQSFEQIDEPRELEIGRQLAAVLLGSKPLVADPAVQRYVNRLGRWISLQSPRPHLPWTFGVLDDPGFNAFAAPGGYVFVTQGLLDRVDEAELAGILAHEITHVTEKHHLKALATKARAGLVTQIVGSQLRQNTAGAISAQMLALGRNLYSSGLDQGDEFEADSQAVPLAAQSGFDPYGLASVLQQLRAATPDNPLFALTLSTHPPAQQRLERIETAMGSRFDTFAASPSVPIPRRLQQQP